jgi:hypothetical protein
MLVGAFGANACLIASSVGSWYYETWCAKTRTLPLRERA